MTALFQDVSQTFKRPLFNLAVDSEDSIIRAGGDGVRHAGPAQGRLLLLP